MRRLVTWMKAVFALDHVPILRSKIQRLLDKTASRRRETGSERHGTDVGCGDVDCGCNCVQCLTVRRNIHWLN